ncbi:sulfite exporter TauE/SafE family protein [Nocardioides sp. LHD-245]|uniref:sulfite exporter TauE/SafE family protein n=1 Tax=Nocardioides sp. LHD-245 TaxID=3051387 RepID=UPI0027DEB6B5|nr:sulfite exporter TauE/SafE family protein [Nocardioides sp. LHD-245]
MSGLEQLVVVLAGLGAGVLSTTVGVASLLSFPVLLAVGLPPVVANVSNTIGLVPSGVGGGIGYREELRVHPRITAAVMVLTGMGGAAGAALLLALPPGVFEAVVPWLILGTCLLVGVQPRLSAWLAAQRGRGGREVHPRLRLSAMATGFVLLTGVYGGYFGAGAGVMMIATLALSLDIDLRVIAGIRTIALLASNLVAALVFVVVAEVDWLAVALLSVSSIVGGYVGARIARRLPAAVLRMLVVVAGVSASTVMLVG